MKHAASFSRSATATRFGFALAAALLLTAIALPRAQAAVVESKGQTIPLNAADSAEAELRVGSAGKFAVMLKFADGQTQTLLGAVKADVLKRLVEKDGKKMPESVPMADEWIEFTGAGLRFQYHSRPRLSRYREAFGRCIRDAAMDQVEVLQVLETLEFCETRSGHLFVVADHERLQILQGL